jgi:HK97 family phage major capsid protein
MDRADHLSAAAGDRLDHLLRAAPDRNTDSSWIAKATLMTETSAYRSAFVQVLTQAHPVLSADEAHALRAYSEFRAMSLTDNVGGYGVPVTLDPTIILTGQQSGNPVRELARTETITSDVWKGVSAAGVSFSFDPEAAAVSDDTPTLAQPTVTPHMARGFIPYSIEIGQDYPMFAQELGRLLTEGLDELLAEKFITGAGDGSNEPWGILTELEANTNVQVAVTTSGTFVAGDLSKVWVALPDRAKANATWLMSSNVEDAISSWGDAYATRTADLAGRLTSLRGRPHVTSAYMDSFTAATTGQTLAIVGDWSRYLVVYRAGLTVEPIPHLFDVTSNLPTGQRGLFAFGRVGAASVDDTAFRALVAEVG